MTQLEIPTPPDLNPGVRLAKQYGLRLPSGAEVWPAATDRNHVYIEGFVDTERRAIQICVEGVPRAGGYRLDVAQAKFAKHLNALGAESPEEPLTLISRTIITVITDTEAV